jgi:hypothetical protein
MHAADFVGAVEIGERSCNAQHAMIAARAESRIASAASRNSVSPLPSGRATSSSMAPDTAALVRICGSPIAA